MARKPIALPVLQSLRPRVRRAAFTLIEIMLVIAIIATLASIGVPNYIRARKRSQAAVLMEDLRMIDHAMELYASEHRRSGKEAVASSDCVYFTPYMKAGTTLASTLPNDVLGNPFTFTTLNEPPRISQDTFDELAEVAPLDYWFPYAPVP